MSSDNELDQINKKLDRLSDVIEKIAGVVVTQQVQEREIAELNTTVKEQGEKIHAQDNKLIEVKILGEAMKEQVAENHKSISAASDKVIAVMYKALWFVMSLAMGTTVKLIFFP